MSDSDLDLVSVTVRVRGESVIRTRAWLARVRGADTIWLHSHERGGGV